MCKRINIFYPILLGGYVVLSIVASIILGLLDFTELPLWLSLLLSQGILVLIALGYVAVNKINIIKAIPYRKMRIGDVFLSILFGYLIVPLVLFISNISMLFSTNHVAESSNELITYPFLLQIFLMAMIPPMVEEFICRGLFYHSYRKNGILGAALTSGLVFGVLHLNINQFCYAFVLGAIFALLVEATGSIWSSVLAHFAFNTYSVIMMKLSSIIINMSGGNMEEIMEEATEVAEQGTMEALVTQLVGIFSIGIFAIGFTALAYLLFVCLAKRNGRWGYMVQNVKMGLKPRNGEKFIDFSFIITTVVAFAYMILAEYFLV